MDSDKKADASKRIVGAAGTPKAAGGARKFSLTPSSAAGTGTAAEQKGNYNNKLSNSHNEQKVDI